MLLELVLGRGEKLDGECREDTRRLGRRKIVG
jgi:hypothetical protein